MLKIASQNEELERVSNDVISARQRLLAAQDDTSQRLTASDQLEVRVAGY